MYKLENWYFELCGKGNVIAWGLVYDNPRFPQGTFIHTSTIREISFEEENEQVVITTNSGSHYALNYSEINIEVMEYTRACSSALNISVSTLDKMVKCTTEYRERLQNEIAEKLQPKELYLVISGSSVVSAYFKKEDGGIVEPRVNYHSGMFVDSVLITYSGVVDFRYYPKSGFRYEMEPYHWSDGLEQIRLYNVGSKVTFKGSEQELICETGESIIIKSEDYHGEGLISPDCVNGKSAFINPEQRAK